MRKTAHSAILAVLCLAAAHCGLDLKGRGTWDDAGDPVPDDPGTDMVTDWTPDLENDADGADPVDPPVDPPPDVPPDPVEDPVPDSEPDTTVEPDLEPDPEPDPEIEPELEPDAIVDMIVDRIDAELACIDEDDDGVCLIADCNDGDPNNWSSCDTCLDGDGDGHYAGCDRYATIPGPDCDDGNTDRFPGNAETCDGVDNDCDSATDDGITCAVVTQGATTLTVTPVQTDLCLGDFCVYDYDVCRCIPTPMNLRRVNRTVLFMAQSTCDGLSLVVLHDAMSGGGGQIDGIITNNPAGVYTHAVHLIDDYWGEDPCSYSSPSFNCQWGWSSYWGGDGMCAGFYTGNCCITFDFFNTSGMSGISIYDGAAGLYHDFSYTPDVIMCIQTVPEVA